MRFLKFSTCHIGVRWHMKNERNRMEVEQGTMEVYVHIAQLSQQPTDIMYFREYISLKIIIFGHYFHLVFHLIIYLPGQELKHRIRGERESFLKQIRIEMYSAKSQFSK